MGGDGGGILRHINPHPARTDASFADAKVGHRQPDTSDGTSGYPSAGSPLLVGSRLRSPATVPRPTVCPPVARKGTVVD